MSGQHHSFHQKKFWIGRVSESITHVSIPHIVWTRSPLLEDYPENSRIIGASPLALRVIVDHMEGDHVFKALSCFEDEDVLLGIVDVWVLAQFLKLHVAQDALLEVGCYLHKRFFPDGRTRHSVDARVFDFLHKIFAADVTNVTKFVTLWTAWRCECAVSALKPLWRYQQDRVVSYRSRGGIVSEIDTFKDPADRLDGLSPSQMQILPLPARRKRTTQPSQGPGQSTRRRARSIASVRLGQEVNAAWSQGPKSTRNEEVLDEFDESASRSSALSGREKFRLVGKLTMSLDCLFRSLLAIQQYHSDEENEELDAQRRSYYPRAAAQQNYANDVSRSVSTARSGPRPHVSYENGTHTQLQTAEPQQPLYQDSNAWNMAQPQVAPQSIRRGQSVGSQHTFQPAQSPRTSHYIRPISAHTEVYRETETRDLTPGSYRSRANSVTAQVRSSSIRTQSEEPRYDFGSASIQSVNPLTPQG
ncbi:hypothetical protein BDV96DRAFT_596874 [Lophiotrema nucula]|uniref:Uncharacterized protein n=1 Tax=Lophiotrema nucula TaxID=690887 RepID=A0A6A5ZJQ4_9PLEO|nr:hypothetical protein BDV96DRAFT_596874 [Lophiotrema nucula]